MAGTCARCALLDSVRYSIWTRPDLSIKYKRVALPIRTVAMEEYLTESVLRGILEEFQWPVPYTLEDDEPDGVFVIFPNCKLYFSEGDRIEVHFLSESSGVEPWLSLFDALRAVRSTSTPDSLPAEPRLIEDIASGPYSKD
jgi:hypothetical protein